MFNHAIRATREERAKEYARAEKVRQPYFDRCNACFMQGEYDEARAACDEFLKKFPPLPSRYSRHLFYTQEMLILSGKIFHAQGKFNNAMDAYSDALDYARSSDTLLMARIYDLSAQTYEALGDNIRAVKACAEALKYYVKRNLFPVGFHEKLAAALSTLTLEDLNSFKSEDIFSIIKRLPEDKQIPLLQDCLNPTKALGVRFDRGFFNRRYQVENHLYKKHPEMRPEQPEVYHKMGKQYVDKLLYSQSFSSESDYHNVIDHAIHQFTKVIQAKNDNEIAAYSYLGYLHLLKGDFQKAEAFCNTAVKKERERWFVDTALPYFIRGIIYHAKGNLINAINCYKEALSSAKGAQETSLHCHIALAYEQLGCYDRAVKHYSDSLITFNEPIRRSPNFNYLSPAMRQMNQAVADPYIRRAHAIAKMTPEQSKSFSKKEISSMLQNLPEHLREMTPDQLRSTSSASVIRSLQPLQPIYPEIPPIPAEIMQQNKKTPVEKRLVEKRPSPALPRQQQKPASPQPQKTGAYREMEEYLINIGNEIDKTKWEKITLFGGPVKDDPETIKRLRTLLNNASLTTDANIKQTFNQVKKELEDATHWFTSLQGFASQVKNFFGLRTKVADDFYEQQYKAAKDVKVLKLSVNPTSAPQAQQAILQPTPTPVQPVYTPPKTVSVQKQPISKPTYQPAVYMQTNAVPLVFPEVPTLRPIYHPVEQKKVAVLAK